MNSPQERPNLPPSWPDWVPGGAPPIAEAPVVPPPWPGYAPPPALRLAPTLERISRAAQSAAVVLAAQALAVLGFLAWLAARIIASRSEPSTSVDDGVAMLVILVVPVLVVIAVVAVGVLLLAMWTWRGHPAGRGMGLALALFVGGLSALALFGFGLRSGPVIAAILAVLSAGNAYVAVALAAFWAPRS